MNTRHPHRTPDFFAVLLVLVVIGFGMTLAIQIGMADRDRMVDTEVVQVDPNAG
ncbi:MAG: hypothetical protein KZQ73_16435 [Candidatus Thiodiazotropha sp. (ex Semelilucina semeliformis)]|nr:hypothetical protein [Candidatus Thiodiazotropha sp. (ex Myrtea spinifera)]MCU7809435.1 hypothetical protein [Candidatus Thiodiazotropha sp. (ex Semelilucina semeliformis)]MCU7828934.1 hypothetical protein [Candidatus Thiodiazotropha sp. (ex Myrtea sp. 'scaly one' KF741663)]